MTSENLENLTLRQKLSQADRLARELLDQLEHGVIPKASSLGRTAKQGMDAVEGGGITDLTIRSHVEHVLKAGNFLRQNADQLLHCLTSIEQDLERACHGTS